MRRALVFVLLALAANAKAITVADYIASLEQLHASLAANQFAAANAQARALESQEVVWAGGTFHADDPLLERIATARRPDPQLVRELELTIDEIRRAVPDPGSAANQKILDEVANAQKVPPLEKGGEVPTTLKRDVPLLERIARAIGDALEWIAKKLQKLLDWLRDFFPRSDPSRPSATAGMRWIVITIVSVIVLLVIALAFEVVRRSRRSEPTAVEASAPIGSKRDEDPLSRGATEWERYAAQLAADGRYREAIRAWYHAVLVTCYASNVLYFRKGRTNWEYVAALPPSLAWRAEFITLTRRFEHEWYGSLRSTADALEECSERARLILTAVRA